MHTFQNAEKHVILFKENRTFWLLMSRGKSCWAAGNTGSYLNHSTSRNDTLNIVPIPKLTENSQTRILENFQASWLNKILARQDNEPLLLSFSGYIISPQLESVHAYLKCNTPFQYQCNKCNSLKKLFCERGGIAFWIQLAFLVVDILQNIFQNGVLYL